MEPLEVGVVEGGVLAYEFVHGGHVCERTWRYVQVLKAAEGSVTWPQNTRGPRRLRGTLNPPGTAARSNIGRGVCGPGSAEG